MRLDVVVAHRWRCLLPLAESSSALRIALMFSVLPLGVNTGFLISPASPPAAAGTSRGYSPSDW